MPDATASMPVAASRLIGQSAGVRSIYRVVAADEAENIFADKWGCDNAQAVSGNMTHAILACRISGSATVSRRSAGSLTRRRPTIGSVTYLDPHASTQWCSDGYSETCHVYLPVGKLERFAQAEFGIATPPRIRPLFAAEDPWLKGYFQMLASEFELLPADHKRADSLFIEQAEHLVIYHLLRCHADGSPVSRSVERHARCRPNPLPSAALRHVEDYIAVHMASDIQLADLASVACMSVGHFLRGFRAASGTTPHQYVLEQRLSKARRLLRETSLPIARIAVDCGFKTPSHLSAKFRGHFGASPSQYRSSS
jgi:AraC family transcriptional regulator